MLEEKTMEDNKEYYVLNLGNIRPGERAIVDLFFQKSLKDLFIFLQQSFINISLQLSF